MAVRDNSSQIEIGDMGLVIGDRLAVFLTTARSITTGEGAEGLEQASISVDGTRHLQFTVNTIVFALTQEGSLTQQHMSSIK